MKKNDIAAIVLIVAIAMVISYFIANSLIGQPENNPVEVEVVTPIDADFPAPDNRTFNDNSIDPTVTIAPGTPGNNQPFTD